MRRLLGGFGWFVSSIITLPVALLFIAAVHVFYFTAMPLYLLYERIDRLLTCKLLEISGNSLHLTCSTPSIRMNSPSTVDPFWFVQVRACRTDISMKNRRIFTAFIVIDLVDGRW